MEGKVIKEESVGSPCSPLPANVPSGKENRRVGSPLNTSEILTRSRSKVLSKENSHIRITESPKGTGSSRSHSPVLSNGASGGKGISIHGLSHYSSPHHNSCGLGTPGTSTPSGTGGPVTNGTRRTPSPSSNRGGTPTSTNNSHHSTNASSSSNRTSSTNSSSLASSGGSTASNGVLHTGSNRHLMKVKRFLSTLLAFGCDISPDVGERVKSLVFNVVCGHLSIEDFHHTLQEVTSFPLRPFVLPFLRAHLPILQREINHIARLSKQSSLNYIRSHEQVIFESGAKPGEPGDIFHSEATDMTVPGNKRKAAERDNVYENGDGAEGSSSYTSTPKRHAGFFAPPFFGAPLASSLSSSGSGGLSGEFRDYYSSPYGFLVASHHHGHSHRTHDSSGVGSSTSVPQSTPPSSSSGNVISCGSGNSCGNLGKLGPEDEWKNIHVMLNCILSMVEKTKRALSILQNRTIASEGDTSGGPGWLRRPPAFPAPSNSATIENSDELKRQAGEMVAQALRATEDRVAEVKRRAEEAVQEVKRQALVELQRAVAAAEARACEAVASERARLERVLIDSRRVVGESMIVTPSVDSESCWNCGRKALETCSGCNAARYCSSFCQHKDWENHHSACGRGTSGVGVVGGAPGAGASSSLDRGGSIHQESRSSSPINVSNASPDSPSGSKN